MRLTKATGRSLLILALTLLPGPDTAKAQIRPELHRQVRAALAREETTQTARLLEDIARSSPVAFAANNYDYLLARLAQRQGNAAEAKRLYQQVAARGSILSAYALWHQAELARQSAQYADEQSVLDQLLTRHAGFLHRRAVVQRLAASYLRTAKYEAAISTLSAVAGPRGAIARESLAHIGTSQLALGQLAAARATLESLLATGLMDDAALRAATTLDRMDETAKTAIADSDRLRRARVYQLNRGFAPARKHWMAIADGNAQSPNRREALFNLGRGFFLEMNHVDAIRYYQRVHDEFPITEEGEQGFYFVGHCHQALYQVDQAIARYEQFLRLYPQSDYFGYAYLNAIDTLRLSDRLEEAVRWATRAQSEVRDPFVITRALFDRAKIRLTQGSLTAALADLNALATRNLGLRGMVATTNVAEVAFLRALCFEQLGRFDEAVATYLGMPEGRSDAAGYYGSQATGRLRALGRNLRAKRLLADRLEIFVREARTTGAGDAAAAKLAATQALRLSEAPEIRDEMLRILSQAYSKLPAYRLPALSVQPVGRTSLVGGEASLSRSVADELLFLGLDDEGASELVAEKPSAAGADARNWSYTLAVHCGRGDCPERTLRFAEPILNSLPSDYRLELMQRDLAEVCYPLSFRESLGLHATSRQVDPRFVMSIARQESRYDPEVKSFAAARGLLQFISSTSEQIAAQLNVRDFDQSDLYRADTAILIGSQYLKNLFDEFKTPQAAAAAYNGSEDSVRRWLARAQTSDVDRFVIEIAKRETKDYLFKVMNSYRAYQAIYPSAGSDRGNSPTPAKPVTK